MTTSSAISERARLIERLLDEPKANTLQDSVLKKGASAIIGMGISPSDYEVYVVRKNKEAGSEILGPKQFPAGNYSEDELGSVISQQKKFRLALRQLNAKASRISQLVEDDVEYSYLTTLFWVEIVKMKEFLGMSVHISELITGLMTARFQFLGKDTPASAVNALAKALTIAVEASVLDSSVIDQVLDVLEANSIDPLAVDALRNAHA